MSNGTLATKEKAPLTKRAMSAKQLVELFGDPIAEGSYIPPEVVEKAVGKSVDDRDYSLLVSNLRLALEDYTGDHLGDRMMCRQSKGGIRVLTAEEAVAHGLSTMKTKELARAYWHTKTSLCVNHKLHKLSPAVRDFYEAEMAMQERMILHDQRRRLEGVRQQGGAGEL